MPEVDAVKGGEAGPGRRLAVHIPLTASDEGISLLRRGKAGIEPDFWLLLR
jgi:hypothetical protein